MPKVPYSDNVLAPGPMGQGPMPSETDFAMAAAGMHAQGRLFQTAGDVVPMPSRDTTPGTSGSLVDRINKVNTLETLDRALGRKNVIPLIDPRGK